MQTIKAKAFSLLAKRAYFSKQLRDKLLLKGYKRLEVDALLEELSAAGWINDLELAEKFVDQQRAKGYGPSVIAYKLREKAGEIDLLIEDSEEALLEFIAKRYKKDLPEKREKVIAALLRRGHPYRLINKVLESMMAQA